MMFCMHPRKVIRGKQHIVFNLCIGFVLHTSGVMYRTSQVYYIRLQYIIILFFIFYSKIDQFYFVFKNLISK